VGSSSGSSVQSKASARTWATETSPMNALLRLMLYCRFGTKFGRSVRMHCRALRAAAIPVQRTHVVCASSGSQADIVTLVGLRLFLMKMDENHTENKRCVFCTALHRPPRVHVASGNE
jgi:hypothetical protein